MIAVKDNSSMKEDTEPHAVVSARGIKVHFGAVKALDGADLTIHAGECIGLVGHNGAGKSTIVNVINGGLNPHEGTITYDGNDKAHGINAARAYGIRCVFQELSLAPNLTVVENMRVVHHGLSGWNWRRQAAGIVRAKLDEIFAGHKIDVMRSVGELSIAERQMVEIAITFCTVGQKPKLVILDEPTSSLDAGLAEQLMTYVRAFVQAGGAVMLISHILGEILSTASRILVMKDGRVVADRAAQDFNVRSLVQAMGSVVKEQDRKHGNEERTATPPILTLPSRRGRGLTFEVRKGEVVGLAGLAGHGQTDMLLDLHRSLSGNWLPGRRENITFVAGDRSLNGTFPLWSILKNLSIASLGDLSKMSLVNKESEKSLGAEWKGRIEIRTPTMENGILSLSGGNQQKVLFARALATTAPIVLMDDPMRGVDIGTKQEVYRILNDEASAGRTFIWYSTEMDEIRLCDRAYVFRDGVIVAELVGEEITEENVLAASFAGEGA
ncbi:MULTISPECIES: sugar ABC transporter ATP-binding protein [Rhizobium]|uniref:Sugar ABC transporter ATP-binding protein n=2 Tax=Rhizobium tropici TaxID=398 RepID=A0A329YCD4_RHITR|nr:MULTISPECIES: sugar ABC transporter ATP-binding protein [Rhizobium]MBB3285792.1 ribose transport system ATP-binding protein [Rhizobium sp. BK252]MBB3400532.1 ribose transport system ATP-binding protein [Rhizobium sp. BK289]MBB3413111.1 ribose transport system ATP-binding protein [Rhizobium sp. BK284]MBB3480998.1 ribose transport system ATP-binding protein [Rhizobium sp. BK347]MDK4721672.1 sugar ABC transporter ATP-binding protein [Rhizobium sp. CNPSo 3968]